MVEDMLNSLDDCGILEKGINLTDVHEHNDVLGSMNAQEFRSRHAKHVYYNCSRVVCEYQGYKRDREPSRVPVNIFKRLSQKSRKLKSYIWCRFSLTIQCKVNIIKHLFIFLTLLQFLALR